MTKEEFMKGYGEHRDPNIDADKEWINYICEPWNDDLFELVVKNREGYKEEKIVQLLEQALDIRNSPLMKALG